MKRKLLIKLILLLGTVFLSSVVLTGEASAQTLTTMATTVRTVAVSIGIPIAVVGWVVAGIIYLTSAGSPERMGTAKKAVVAAAIGTVIVALAGGAGPIINVIKNAVGIS